MQNCQKFADSPSADLDRQIASGHEGDKQLADTLEAVLWQRSHTTATTLDKLQ